MKARKLLLSVIFGASLLRPYAQSVENYLKSAADYSPLYSGETESGYSPSAYENLPYYNSSDVNFGIATGDLIYKNILYPNQRLKLDLYRERLIVLTPNGHGVILNSRDVRQASIFGRTIVWHEAAGASDFQSGLYIQLYKSDRMTLFSKITLGLNKITEGMHIAYRFTPRTRYYLLIEGKYHTVKNKGSFTELLPEYKREIRQYVKDMSLRFGKDKDADLSLLAQYCETLLSL